MALLGKTKKPIELGEPVQTPALIQTIDTFGSVAERLARLNLSLQEALSRIATFDGDLQIDISELKFGNVEGTMIERLHNLNSDIDMISQLLDKNVVHIKQIA